MLANPTVVTARDAAIKAAALAAVPGADRLSRVTALETARDADKALAVQALAAADALVTALPAAPLPADTSNTELTGNRDALFREASAALEAASASAAKWRESAVAVVEGVRTALAELAAIAAKNPVGNDRRAERDEPRGTGRHRRRRCQDAPGAVQGAPSTMTKLFKKTEAWAKWVNAKGKHANAMADDIVNTHAIAIAQSNEGARNTENFTAMPRETLIRNAATLKRQTMLPGAGTNDLQNCSMGGVDDAFCRMKHIAGRHGRESYEYGNLVDGGPTPEQYAAARVLAARYAGNASPPGTADPKLRELVALGKSREKVNSLLPEEVTNANLNDVIQKALIASRDASVPPTMAQLLLDAGMPPAWVERLVNVDIPPIRPIKIGIKNEGGKPKADMMSGDSTNTMTMPDMAAMGRAVGL